MPPRILVVEDDRYFAGILRDYLVWLGCDVDEAANGLTAWEQVGRAPPDLVLCDVLLPRLDGSELASRIKARADTAALPVLLMSAIYRDPESIAELIERSGADGFLPKPFAMSQLRDALVQWLPGLRPADDVEGTDHGDETSAQLRVGPASTLPASGAITPGFLAPLLLRIRATGHSGTLELKDESRWKRLVFQDGRPIWADGGGFQDRMGTMLLEEGTIDRDDFGRAVELMRQESIDFGTALTRLKILTHTELYKQLQRLVERRVVSAFGWSFGEWTLTSSVPRQTSNFETSPLPLIWRALLAHGDGRQMARDLAGFRDRYVVPTERFAADWPALRVEEGIGFLGSFLSGKRTVHQLDEMEVLPGDDLTRALWLLYQSGLVSFDESPGAPRAAESENSPSTSEVLRTPGSLTALSEKIIGDYLQHWQADFFSIYGIMPDASSEEVAAALKTDPVTWSRSDLPDNLPGTLRRKALALLTWLSEARATLADDNRRRQYGERLHEGLTGIYRKVGGPQEAEASMLFELGRAFMQNRNFREAELSFGKAVERVPESAEYLAYQGWALYRRDGEHAGRDAASALLDRAIELDPHLPIAHYFQGMMHRDRRHHREAAASFSAALEFDPAFEPAREALDASRQLSDDS